MCLTFAKDDHTFYGFRISQPSDDHTKSLDLRVFLALPFEGSENGMAGPRRYTAAVFFGLFFVGDEELGEKKGVL